MSNSPAALAELIRAPLSKDYRTLDMRHARVILLEATDTLLSAMPERLRAYALAWLGKMGVQVRLRAVASQVTPESVQLQDGTLISTETVGWTAGVRGDPQAGTWGLPVARNGQVIVLPTLQVPDHPEVYVLGDLARVEQNGQPLPMIAPVAIQQGMTVARNIAHQAAGQSPQPFHYHDRGAMVTIGRNAAVTHLSGHDLSGFPAWVIWLGVHIFNLIGFRNRLLVMINWAWDQIFYERAVRLILPRETMMTPLIPFTLAWLIGDELLEKVWRG